MKDVLALAEKGTHALLLASRSPTQPPLLQRRLVPVVVLNGRNRLILRHVEVVVEIRAEGRIPREAPAHALLERFNLGDGRAGHGGEGGVARLEVAQVGHVVGVVRAVGTALGRVGPEHEVVDEELLASLE